MLLPNPHIATHLDFKIRHDNKSYYIYRIIYIFDICRNKTICQVIFNFDLNQKTQRHLFAHRIAFFTRENEVTYFSLGGATSLSDRSCDVLLSAIGRDISGDDFFPT